MSNDSAHRRAVGTHPGSFSGGEYCRWSSWAKTDSDAPAGINLAHLYRQLGRDGEGEGVLRAGIAASPRDAGLHHSLGLTLTRLKRPNDSLRTSPRLRT